MSMMSWEQAVSWMRAQNELRDVVRFCYYDDPILSAANRFWQSEEWTAVRKLVSIPAARALDLGAGRGISSYALARDGWQVVALEPDTGVLVGAAAIRALASEAGLDIEVRTEFSESLPFEDCSFELVNCRQVLHHARDLRQTCREIARVLKPGGLLVATREHVISQRKDLQVFLEAHPLHRLYGGENAYLLHEYSVAINESGLRVIKTIAPHESPINYFPLSEAQHIAQCARLLTGRLGRFVAHRLLNPRRLIGKLILRKLEAALNRRDDTPGRLYSFVAKKPVVRE